MSRSTKPAKPYIVVFCEGESEQAYTDFLRKEFKDVASIHRPKATGLFDVADNKYKKDAKYRDYAEVTDEVWFFFDVETKDIQLPLHYLNSAIYVLSLWSAKKTQNCHNIGTVLLFRRKSGYAILKMLKSI